MVDILVQDYNSLSLEERVRAIEAAERFAKTLVGRDISRIEEEKEKDNIDIGAIYLNPRQCVEMLAQELGTGAPEVQSLLRRDEAELRLDPRMITMQETWKEEKLYYLDRYWWWDPEDESNVPLTKEQLRVARSLAYLYGHNWAWALAGRPPGRGMHAKRPPLLTAADIYRYTVGVLVEDYWGTYAPEVVNGNIVHVTGTGRLTWVIRPDGSVQFTVCRPAGWVLRAELGATRPRTVAVVRNPAIPLHRRHVEALERPIKRLAPRWVVPDTIGPILND